MKIALTGSRGFLGSALIPALQAAGHEVIRIVRSQADAGPGQVRWDPAAPSIDPAGLEGLDALIHLAGENLASGRWTAERKARIRNSRIQGTQLLSDTLARLKRPPRVLLSASAVGYYGDRADEVLTEESAAGRGFLADVCRAWENAAATAAQSNVRVALLRFGVILDVRGGALAKMLLPFRLGLGGRFGSGRQYLSWIGLDDAVRAVSHVLTTETLSGPINVSSPEPVTNREFTKALGQLLRRPAWLAVPAWALRLAVGQMADEALLASTRVAPAKLQDSGFRFAFPQLASTLRQTVNPVRH